MGRAICVFTLVGDFQQGQESLCKERNGIRSNCPGLSIPALAEETTPKASSRGRTHTSWWLLSQQACEEGLLGAPPHPWASRPPSVKESRAVREKGLGPVQPAVVSTHLSAHQGVPYLETPSPCLSRDCSKSKKPACKGSLFICLIKRRLPATLGSIRLTYNHVPAKLNIINTGRLKAKGTLEIYGGSQKLHRVAVIRASFFCKCPSPQGPRNLRTVPVERALDTSVFPLSIVAKFSLL